MAGYSGTPQARKLGIKPGLRAGLDRPAGQRLVWRVASRGQAGRGR